MYRHPLLPPSGKARRTENRKVTCASHSVACGKDPSYNKYSDPTSEPRNSNKPTASLLHRHIKPLVVESTHGRRQPSSKASPDW